jgi:hypothetical protein
MLLREEFVGTFQADRKTEGELVVRKSWRGTLGNHWHDSSQTGQIKTHLPLYFMRAILKYTIRFGLLTLIASLIPETRRKELKFRLQRASDLSLGIHNRVAKADGKKVPWGKKVKPYEYSKGKYALLKDEDFARPKVRRKVAGNDFMNSRIEIQSISENARDNQIGHVENTCYPGCDTTVLTDLRKDEPVLVYQWDW